jgi:Domain of unknown function (DUF1906)
MGAIFGVDYAWGRPSMTALLNARVRFVCRYLSHDITGKNLDRAEAVRLSNAGIYIVVVWESTANRALAGYSAGAQDARAALAQAIACGMPAGRPIYFAVDFDANASQRAQVNAYLDGAASVLTRKRTGVYGSYSVVQGALGAHCDYAWQTYAWSGGKWDNLAQLQQYSNDHVIDGVGLDYDRAVTADYGQWLVGEAPSVDPVTTQEDDMPSGELREGVKAITPIALPKGRYKTIGFTADNGLQVLPPAALRVAVHHGGGKWEVTQVTVDSAKGQAVVKFQDPANTDGISVQRADAGTVHVGWEIS